jgi:SAM-dependent methyltransferase
MTIRNEVSARRALEALVAGIFDSGTACILDGSFAEQIGDCVEADTTAVRSPEELVRDRCRPDRRDLLDFGCGNAAYRPMLEAFGYRWRGVNYKEGMAREAADSASGNADIVFYDGLTLPFPDATFDVVYSFQTFEHIQRIDVTFAEIARVLRPGGALIGAMSYLEQVHDYSTYNFTPYGLKLAARDAGMRLTRVYPRFDAFTFLLRRLLVSTSGSDDNSLSPALQVDNAIGLGFVEYGQRLGLTPAQINLFRLTFSTHFAFEIERP